MSFYPSKHIVIEPGSYTTKAGFSDYQNPPTITALTRIDQNGWKYPIVSGRVTDWIALKQLWTQILVGNLGVKLQTNQYPVLLSISSGWGRKDVERATQILFEDLNVPGLYVVEQPLASVFGCGLSTALVIDIGHHTTTVTAVVEGTVIELSQQTLPVGAADIKTQSDSLDVLFRPEIVDKDTIGLHEAIQHSINTFEVERRSVLWDSLLLVGGGCRINGIKERIEKELSVLIAASETANEHQPKDAKWVKPPEYFVALKDRMDDVSFFGASIMAKITFVSPNTYFSKLDYAEFGPSAVFTKITA